MSAIRAGSIAVFDLFDVAQSIDLGVIPSLTGGPTVPARLAPKQSTPSYIQYDRPPVSFDGDAVGVGEVEGFAVRFRLYDYGVLSIALTRPYAGEWSALIGAAQGLIDNADLERHADRLCRTMLERLRPALVAAHPPDLSEDYIVFAVTDLDPPLHADDLLATEGDNIAALLRGERQPLSRQEKDNILRHRISYLADDLVVPTWNTAFVYDTPSGLQAALEIIEFANSQLLEFRYYDERLDQQLAAIYAGLQRPRRWDRWIGTRYTRAAREVHALFIDVNELTDRAENALKFIGDIYAARLFWLIGHRLGLETWKAHVESKLETLDDIYRFAVEQSSMSRGELMELTIVLILVLELFLFFIGVME